MLTTKRVLREAMRGMLPETIRMRMDKMGLSRRRKFGSGGEGQICFARNCANRLMPRRVSSMPRRWITLKESSQEKTNSAFCSGRDGISFR